MGLVNVVWSVISVLLVLNSGILFFHKKITTLDKLGIVLLLVLLGISLIVCEN